MYIYIRVLAATRSRSEIPIAITQPTPRPSARKRAIHDGRFSAFLTVEKGGKKLFCGIYTLPPTKHSGAPFFSIGPEEPPKARIASKLSIQNGLSRQLNFPRCSTTENASLCIYTYSVYILYVCAHVYVRIYLRARTLHIQRAKKNSFYEPFVFIANDFPRGNTR